MPRLLLRLAGIVLICSACSVPIGQTDPVPESTPTPSTSAGTSIVAGRSNAPWAMQLTLAGDLTRAVTATAPSQGGLVNECTGKNSLRSNAWSSTFVLPGAGGPVALIALAPAYHGAGTYSDGVSIQVHNPDLSAVWQNRSGDAVSWTVGGDEESGRITATLTNLSDLTRKLTVSGTWTCRT